MWHSTLPQDSMPLDWSQAVCELPFGAFSVLTFRGSTSYTCTAQHAETTSDGH
jgi:hypothetical protein